MKKVCIVCSSKLPNPPVLGGAVSQLIQNWVDENELTHKYELTCISVFNKDAKGLSNRFNNTSFIYIKISRLSKFLDSITTKFLNLIKKTNKIYSWGFLFRTLYFRRGVKRQLKKSNFDIVIFENSIPVALCMKSPSLKRKYKGKYYYHTHCVPRKAFGSGKVLERANAVICVSKYIADATKKRFENYKLKFDVLYNCVDTSIFKPLEGDSIREWRNKFSLKQDDFTVGFIGRLSKDKGIFELVEAIKKIDDLKIKLLVAGSTFYDSNVKDKLLNQLAKISESIKDRIVFTGYIKNSETPLFYGASDLICLPPVWEEPGAVTNIEAAACGRPILSTISGGNPEYIGDNKAILLDKSDKSELIDNIAKNIIFLKIDDDRRNELAENAFKWASKQTKSEFLNRLVRIIGE